MGAGWNLFVSM